MVRKRSPFWYYAEQSGDKFKCKYCKKEYSGGATRLTFHLSGIKGNDIEICSQVPDDVRGKAFLAVTSNSKRIKTDSQDHSLSLGFSGMSNLLHLFKSNGGAHETSDHDMLSNMDKNDVDRLLTKFLISNDISPGVVETQSFIDFVRGLCEFGPTYSLPSCSTLRTKLFPDAKNEVDEYVEKVKKSWEKTGCTIMLDTWCDMESRCYVNFVAHSPGGTVFLQSVEISKERKSCHLLEDLCCKVIESVGPQHVVQFISGNASGFDDVGDMLVGKYPTIHKSKCAARGIQLLFDDIYAEVEWVRSVVDDAVSVQSYIQSHEIVTALVRDAMPGKELRKPYAAGFASIFLVLQSLVAVENELRMCVASPQWRGLDFSKTTEGNKITQIVQNDDFWSQARDGIQILEPLVCVLRLVDSDRSAFGYLYEAMEEARESIELKSIKNEEKYGHIRTLFEKRRNDYIISPIHAAAAFLNPSYLLSDSFRETSEMKRGISYIFDNLVTEDEKQSFLEQVQLYRITYAPLFTSSARAMLKTSHPRIWWDYCGDTLPVLQKHAIRILSQPCSCSSSKQNWSSFQVAQTRKRERLPPRDLGTMVYVRMNSMMKENFHKKEVEYMKPIDLDTLQDWPDYGGDADSEMNKVINTEDESSVFSSWQEDIGIFNLESICLTIGDDNNDDSQAVIYDGGGLDQGQNIRQGEEYEKQLPTPDLGITPLENLGASFMIKERMTRALQHFKESTEQNDILAQVWAPVKHGNRYVLTTWGQPFVLDPHSKNLHHYRSVSEKYIFSADEEINGVLGLPGRVFRQKLPEWTPNVQYYTFIEFPRFHYAWLLSVRGTLALPIFEPSGQSCIGVLELVMTSEKIKLAPEVDKVCKALEAVNLKTSELLHDPNTQVHPEGHQIALAEMLQFLKNVCETYRLPMAQTWVPCMHKSVASTSTVCMSTANVAFYVFDADFSGFRDASAEHHLQAGQGPVGKAFASHGSRFFWDLSNISKTKYPLSHYARVFGLACSFSMCLKSKHTGDDVYIPEFFLPPSFTDAADLSNLMDNILTAMERHLPSFVVASGRTLEE